MSNKGPSLSDNKGPAANLVKKKLLHFALKILFAIKAVFETDPKLDHAPIVRHVALSSIDFGHKKTISDIRWVPNHIEASRYDEFNLYILICYIPTVCNI